MEGQRAAAQVAANHQRQAANRQLIAGHYRRVDRLGNALTVQRCRRQDKRRQHHRTIAQQAKAEVHQAAVEVHHHHPGKTENTAQRLVIAELIVLVDEVRQQHAEEGPGGVHNRPFHPGGEGQTDVEEDVL